MTLRSWIRNLFGLTPRSPARNGRRVKRPNRSLRLCLETLEDRVTPSGLQLSPINLYQPYNAALSFTPSSPGAGNVGTPISVEGQTVVAGEHLLEFLDTVGAPDLTHLTALINWSDGTTNTVTSASTSVAQIVFLPSGGTTPGTNFAVVSLTTGAHSYDEALAAGGGNTSYFVRVMDDGVLSPPMGTIQDGTPLNPPNGVYEVQLAAFAVNPAIPASPNEGSTLTSISATNTVATFTDPPGSEAVGDYTASIDWGDGSGAHAGTVVNLGAGNFEIRDASGHSFSKKGGPYTLTVTVQHESAPLLTQTLVYTVVDAPITDSTPTPNLLTAVEGMPFTKAVLATFTDADPTATVNDFTASATFTGAFPPTDLSIAVQLASVGPNSSNWQVVLSGTFPEEGTLFPSGSLSVTVTDVGGGGTFTNAVSTSFTVSDPAVVATAGPSINCTENGSTNLALLASFTDPAGPEALSEYDATVTWGDGSGSNDTRDASPNIFIVQPGAGLFLVEGTHTYAEEAAAPGYPITTVIHHHSEIALAPEVNTTVNTQTAIVSDQQLVNLGSANLPGVGVEGSPVGPITGIARFTDPAGVGVEPILDFPATINWGDGATSPGTVVSAGGGNYTVNAPSHIYAEEGTFNVTVTLTHDLLSPVTTPAQSIIVSDPSVVLNAAPLAFNSKEGQLSAVQTVATFTDPGGAESNGDYSAVINWSDSTTSAGIITSSGGVFSVLGSHSYTEENSYSISVTVSHGTAAAMSGSTAIATVAEQSLVLNAVPLAISGNEGTATGNVTVATFTDPAGPELTTSNPTPGEYAADINWGDGITDTATTNITWNPATQSFSVIGNHTYADEGSYNITVTAHHGTLSPQTSVTAAATIADLQPTNLGASNLPGATLENVSIGAITTIASFTDPAGVGNETTANFTATVNWGDGTTSPGTIVSANGGNYTVNAPAHTYVEEGIYTVNVTLMHDLLSALTTPSQSITITDAPLTAGPITPSNAVAGNPTASAVLFHFTDANSGATLSHFTATVTWGDGSVQTSLANPTFVQVVAGVGGGFDVLGSHTYLTATAPGAAPTGPLSFSVHVNDTGGSFTGGTGPVAVSGDAVIHGTAGNDTLNLTLTNTFGTASYTLNGGTSVTLQNLHSISFDGTYGIDTMTVDANGEMAVTQPTSQSPFGQYQVTFSPAGANQISQRLPVLAVYVTKVNLDKVSQVNAEAGPDTADRGAMAASRAGTAFPAGLTAQEQAVQALYLDALGRAGSKAELDGWVAQLPANAITLTPEVVKGIEQSPEARDHLVRSWYVAYLGRHDDGTEEQGWVNLLGAGQSNEQVLSRILGSAEFFGRAGNLVGGDTASNTAYVQALYQLLLGRAGETGGLNSWLGLVASGGSRAQVALGILQSGEFRTDQFVGYYDVLLHRSSDLAGLNNWVMSNLDIQSVRHDFEASPEFFTNG